MKPLVRFLVAAIGIAPAAVHAQTVDYASLQALFGEPVTTSVTGKPQRASAAPASIVIVTRDEIAQSSARSVPDLLKAYAGIDVTRWTAGQSDITIRGGVQTYNARLLVLVDGRQVYLDHYGMTDWNLLGVPLEAIQQIELVRGPGSALFGFNAASGVVNIITISPTKAPTLAATIEGGTHGYSRLSGAATIPLDDRLAIKIAGGHQRENERRVPDTISAPPAIRDVVADQVNGSITATPDAATRVELSGGYAYNDQLEFPPTSILLQQRFRNRTTGLTVDHDTGWGSVSGQAYANWLTADYGTTGAPELPVTGLSNIRFRNRIVVAKTSSLIRIDSVDTLRVEAEYRNNQLFSKILYAPRVGYQNAAIDGMIDLHPSDSVAITVAARLDRLWLDLGGEPAQPMIDPLSAYDRTIVRGSFNAALLIRVGADGQLRINGGRGVQSPSLIDFGFRLMLPNISAPFPVYASGNPRIEPATTWSGEIGYDQRLASGLRLEGSVFFTRTDNVIAVSGGLENLELRMLPAFSAIARFSNIGSFETYGISIAANGRLTGRVGWLANYTWTRVHEAEAYSEPPFAATFAPAAATARHIANAGLNYGGQYWFASTTARYTSATRQLVFDRNGEIKLFPIHRAIGIDAKLGYHLTKHLDAYAAGENLSAADGAAGSPIPADRRLRVGLSYTL